MRGTDGSIDVIAYSGGAQAFTTAYGQLSAAEQARIGSILYISPGAVGTLTVTGDLGRTSVVMGSGPVDITATFGTIIPSGVSTTWTSCSHSDLECLLKAAGVQMSEIASRGSCTYQDVFQRGSGGSGGGGGRGGDLTGIYPIAWTPIYVYDAPFFGGGGGGGGGTRDTRTRKVQEHVDWSIRWW
jgi:hypothetical protein